MKQDITILVTKNPLLFDEVSKDASQLRRQSKGVVGWCNSRCYIGDNEISYINAGEQDLALLMKVVNKSRLSNHESKKSFFEATFNSSYALVRYFNILYTAMLPMDVLFIEYPENGLHPTILRNFLEDILSLSKAKDIIIMTHNDLFIGGRRDLVKELI